MRLVYADDVDFDLTAKEIITESALYVNKIDTPRVYFRELKRQIGITIASDEIFTHMRLVNNRNYSVAVLKFEVCASRGYINNKIKKSMSYDNELEFRKFAIDFVAVESIMFWGKDYINEIEELLIIERLSDETSR